MPNGYSYSFVRHTIYGEGQAQKDTLGIVFALPARLLGTWELRSPSDCLIQRMDDVHRMFVFRTVWPLTGLRSVNTAD